MQEARSERPERDPDPEIEPFFKQRIFPIGLPRKFSVFIEPAHPVQYEHICASWGKICQDAEKFLGMNTLPETCPPKRNDDRLFFEIKDENGASLLEGSDGKANFLFMIVSIRRWEPGSVLLIEEPEISMHPGLQKQFLDYLKHLVEEDNYQFLISTHSPYLMNLAATNNGDKITIFRLSKDLRGYTQIRLAQDSTESWAILTDLGHSPADVLHANGVIWVEGPSDLIYLSVWLEELAPKLRRGKDYEIMWYGGANFTHLGAEDVQKIRETFWQNQETSRKLISLFSLNQNWAFIVDSDSDKESHNDERVVKTYETINKQKDSFIEECTNVGKFTWKVDPYIEKCILGRDERPAGKSKVDWAHEYKNDFTVRNVSDCSLSPEAHEIVNKLITEIREWR